MVLLQGKREHVCVHEGVNVYVYGYARVFTRVLRKRGLKTELAVYPHLLDVVGRILRRS